MFVFGDIVSVDIVDCGVVICIVNCECDDFWGFVLWFDCEGFEFGVVGFEILYCVVGDWVGIGVIGLEFECFEIVGFGECFGLEWWLVGVGIVNWDVVLGN